MTGFQEGGKSVLIQLYTYGKILKPTWFWLADRGELIGGVLSHTEIKTNQVFTKEISNGRIAESVHMCFGFWMYSWVVGGAAVAVKLTLDPILLWMHQGWTAAICNQENKSKTALRCGEVSCWRSGEAATLSTDDAASGAVHSGLWWSRDFAAGNLNSLRTSQKKTKTITHTYSMRWTILKSQLLKLLKMVVDI